MTRITRIAAVWLLCSATPAVAGWSLDNAASELTFISIKASDIGEVHRFTELSGVVSDDGSAFVTIQLASVDTLIPVRDERMREMLFQTGMFPVATISTRISPDLAKLAGGETQILTTEVLVELHGEAAPLIMELAVSRLSDSRILVTSVKPVILNAGMFDLVDGVEQLREVAGLPAISKAVPVSFMLTFAAD